MTDVGEPDAQVFAARYEREEASGTFGEQPVFTRSHIFELFADLAGVPEGSGYTIGLRYVRKADARESKPALKSFSSRRVE